MHSFDKASPRLGKEQLVEDLRTREHIETDRKLHESLNTLIRHSMGDSYASLASWSGEKPVQCIYWPDAFDQHLASKLTRGMKVEVGLEMRDGEVEGNSPGSLKDSSDNGIYYTGGLGKTFQTSGERLQSLKVHQPVVAFTQAAVKINGWPLLSPAKAQLQKCEKCSEEFYSSLNFRRHIRIHRHLLHANKEDLRKEKPRIAAFWNKLSAETASQIISIENMTKEDPSGMATVKALTALIRQPRLSILPQTFVKCGTALLDIIQDKGLANSIRADEFFSILNDASENTFLCGGTSASVQRFVYHRETEKLGLEDKNLVASLAFLIEQKLVKAWMIDKDLEALRCQKELVEEEEAAQKRREKVLEKKRQKKLRQKEKEKQEVINDRQGDLTDDNSILRSEEEGDSPLASSLAYVSPASLKEDLDNIQTSDFQMAQSFSCFEENVLMKSIHTLEQLVRSDSGEGLRVGDSIGPISPSEESFAEHASGQSNMNDDPENCSTPEPMISLHDQVHQAISTVSFQSRTGSIQATRNESWNHSNPLCFQKVFTKNFTDASVADLEYVEGIKLSSEKPLSLSTNGMRKDQFVLTATIKDELAPKASQQDRTRRLRQSKVQVDVLNGSAVWGKKTQLTSADDYSKNNEIMVDTPVSDIRSDNLDERSLQKLPDKTLKYSGTVCSSVDSNESNMNLASPFDKPSHVNKVHEIRLNVNSNSKCITRGSNPKPNSRADDASCIIDSLDSSVGSVDTTLEEKGVSNIAKNEPSFKTFAVNAFESPLETYGGALLIGSLKVPLHSFAAEAPAQESHISIVGADDDDPISFLENEPITKVRVVNEEPKILKQRFGSANRSILKASNIDDREISQLQSMSLAKNEQALNEGDSSYSDCNDQATSHLFENSRTGTFHQASQKQSATSSRNAVPMARDIEADVGQEWFVTKDDKFHSTLWVSISDIAVAAFLSQRWNLALKAMETAAPSV